MFCPHCEKETTSRVHDTRTIEGKVYRRRCCNVCHKRFATVELHDTDIKVPWGEWNRRRNLPAAKQQREDGVIRSDGAHLQQMWM